MELGQLRIVVPSQDNDLLYRAPGPLGVSIEDGLLHLQQVTVAENLGRQLGFHRRGCRQPDMDVSDQEYRTHKHAPS